MMKNCQMLHKIAVNDLRGDPGSETYTELCLTFKMEPFAETFQRLKTLTNFAKSSILDV